MAGRCVLSWQQLTGKRISYGLTDVLKEIIKVLHSIKFRPLKIRFFPTSCEDVESLNTCNLLGVAITQSV
jgi:hypothetical protein